MPTFRQVYQWHVYVVQPRLDLASLPSRSVQVTLSVFFLVVVLWSCEERVDQSSVTEAASDWNVSVSMKGMFLV